MTRPRRTLRSGWLAKTFLTLLGGSDVGRTPGPTPTQPAGWRSVGRWTWRGLALPRPRTLRQSLGFWRWDGFSRLVARARRASASRPLTRGAHVLRAVVWRRARWVSQGALVPARGTSRVEWRRDDDEVALALVLLAQQRQD